MTDRRQCVAVRANGERCRVTTIHPSGYCYLHCNPERHAADCERSRTRAEGVPQSGPDAHAAVLPRRSRRTRQ